MDTPFPLRPFKALWAATWLTASCLSFAAGASSSFGVSGQVMAPKTDTLSTLQALTQITQTDTFGSSTGTQTHTYTGPLLWNVLQDAGGISVNPAIKNNVLNKVVLVTASDGYKVVYSAGELHPNFGNEQALVAWGETTSNVQAPLGSDGFARTTAPLDAKGGRYSSNITGIQVLNTGSTQAATCTSSVPSCTSSSFNVSGDVLHAGSWDLASLSGLTTITQTIAGHSYTGVSFWAFLNSTAGLATHSSVKNDLLDMYVVATGSDGYKAAFSMGELSADFGNSLAVNDSTGPIDMIAFQMDGSNLTTSGFARLVVPNDVRAGRWVSNLVSLEVYHATPVPEPMSWALLMASLAVLAGIRHLGTRRAIKSTATTS